MSDREEQKNSDLSASGWDCPAEASTATPSKTSGVFVDQSESVVATIGSNYLQNYLSGGTISTGIGILTQKRFYYKGKNFSGAGKETKSATEEGVLSIEDITFTKFTHFRHVGFLAFAVLLALAAVIFIRIVVLGAIASAIVELGAIASAIGALTFFILYFVKRESLFLVAFPGGGFAFDIRWYPISDIRDFQRQLHLLKDHIKEVTAA